MDCSMSGFSVHHQLPEITQTHVCWVSDASWTLLKRIRQWHRELVWEAHSISEEKKQHKVIYVSMFGRFKNWIKYLIDCNSSVHGILQASILEWVAISFFRGSSWPNDWTGVSCIAGRFFTIWATKEAQEKNQHKVTYVSMFGRFKNWIKTQILKRTCTISGSYRFLLAKVSKASNNSYRSLIWR